MLMPRCRSDLRGGVLDGCFELLDVVVGDLSAEAAGDVPFLGESAVPAGDAGYADTKPCRDQNEVLVASCLGDLVAGIAGEQHVGRIRVGLTFGRVGEPVVRVEVELT